MILEQALFNYLSTYGGLVALIGTRVYPLRPPQNVVKPYITYGKVSGPRVRTFATNLGGQPRFDFTCSAGDYLSAKNVAVQVQAALEGFSGVMGGVGGVTIVSALQNNEIDMENPETKLYHIVLDFTISYLGA